MSDHAAQPRRRRATFLQRFNLANADGGLENCNLGVVVRVVGRFERPLVDDVVAALIERHEALRTTLHEGERGLEQRIWERLPCAVEDVDLRSRPEALLAELTAFVDADVQILDSGLVRARVLALGVREHVIALRVHHSISDAWSCDILERELCALYLAGATGRPARLAPLPGRSHARAPRDDAPALDAKRAYWRQRLAAPGRPRVPQLVAPPSAERCPWLPRELPAISEATAARLARIAATSRVSRGIVAMAGVAWSFVAGEGDAIRFSVVHTGRYVAGARDVVGGLADFLPVQVDLTGNPTFEQLVARTQAAWLGALGNRLPWDEIGRAAGIDVFADELMCDVTFNYIGSSPAAPTPAADGSGPRIERVIVPWARKRPLISRGCSTAPWSVTLFEHGAALHGLLTAQLGTVSPDALTALAARVADGLDTAGHMNDHREVA